jgi:hypothetical protein
MEDLSAFSAKPRLRLLLKHLSQMKDAQQAMTMKTSSIGECAFGRQTIHQTAPQVRRLGS